MPLMTLEYTDNLKSWNPKQFLLKTHQKLASDFGYNVHKIASRAYLLDQYVLGDGSANLALAFLTVVIHEQHSDAEKEAIRKWVIDELQTELKSFADSLKVKLGCATSEAIPNSHAWVVMT